MCNDERMPRIKLICDPKCMQSSSEKNTFYKKKWRAEEKEKGHRLKEWNKTQQTKWR